MTDKVHPRWSDNTLSEQIEEQLVEKPAKKAEKADQEQDGKSPDAVKSTSS